MPWNVPSSVKVKCWIIFRVSCGGKLENSMLYEGKSWSIQCCVIESLLWKKPISHLLNPPGAPTMYFTPVMLTILHCIVFCIVLLLFLVAILVTTMSSCVGSCDFYLVFTVVQLLLLIDACCY
jgi:hypothetical protein